MTNLFTRSAPVATRTIGASAVPATTVVENKPRKESEFFINIGIPVTYTVDGVEHSSLVRLPVVVSVDAIRERLRNVPVANGRNDIKRELILAEHALVDSLEQLYANLTPEQSSVLLEQINPEELPDIANLTLQFTRAFPATETDIAEENKTNGILAQIRQQRK